MNKYTLSLEEVTKLVVENKYQADPKKHFISRCIDGRYKNDEGLAVQAYPGADLGELATILATARSYGLEIDREKAFKVLVDVLGGFNNFSFHTDHHGDPKKLASGCGHFKQMNLDPDAYKLEKDDIDFISEKLNIAKQKGASETVLEGDHIEAATLIVKGEWGVYPQYDLKTDRGNKFVEVFVYQSTLTDKKHHELAEKLVENKAIKFKFGENAEYLYEILSEVAENHLMETAKRLAPDLPIYSVEFKQDGSFNISPMT